MNSVSGKRIKNQTPTAYMRPEMIRTRELPWDHARFRSYCNAFWQSKLKGRIPMEEELPQT